MNNAERPGGLTPIQRQILQAIRALARGRGRPPCMREVLENIDLDSAGALSYQYGRLEARGYLRREAPGSGSQRPYRNRAGGRVPRRCWRPIPVRPGAMCWVREASRRPAPVAPLGC